MVDTDQDLARLADWLSGWEWPMQKDQLLESAAELGWTVTSDRPGKGARWDTGLPAPGASATVLDGVVTDLTVTTSEYYDEDAAGRRALRDAFASQVEIVSTRLGAPTGRRPGRSPATTWSLPNGSALEVAASAGGCYWTLTSPKFVRIERNLGPGA
jgi:hypothetical protein